MTESTLLKHIRLAATRAGAVLFRNNCGIAFYPAGQAVRFGLCEGSSDLIGFLSVPVSSLPLGSTVAVFVAVEVKAPGGRTARKRWVKQANFLDRVREAGGIGIVAASVEDLDVGLAKYKKGVRE